MIIALYGRTVGAEHAENIRLMFKLFAMHNVKLMVYAPFADYLQSNLGVASSGIERFNTPPEVKGKSFAHAQPGWRRYLFGIGILRRRFGDTGCRDQLWAIGISGPYHFGKYGYGH